MDTVQTTDWIKDVFSLFTTLKGAGAMAIAAAVVQTIMRFFKTPLASFAGKWRLFIVACLSLVATVLSGMAAGASFWACLVSGATLTAFQVLMNQIYKQFVEKKNN